MARKVKVKVRRPKAYKQRQWDRNAIGEYQTRHRRQKRNPFATMRPPHTTPGSTTGTNGDDEDSNDAE